MDITTILKNKAVAAEKIRKKYGFLKKNKAIGLLDITDESISEEIINGLQMLDVNFIIINSAITESKTAKNIVMIPSLDASEMIGCDFVVGDDHLDDFSTYTSKGVTPIIHSTNSFASLLKEYNAMKSEGNAFFYSQNNAWDIFASIVKYMENYKFPYDNKALVKNVLSI